MMATVSAAKSTLSSYVLNVKKLVPEICSFNDYWEFLHNKSGTVVLICICHV